MANPRRGRSNRRSAYYPRFSEEEFDRRRSAVRDLLDERDLEALLVYEYGGFHQGTVSYLTNYEPPFPTYLLCFADPDEDATLFVGVSNHLQYVREVSVVEEVRLLLPDPPSTVVERLREADVAGRVGVVADDPRYNLSLPRDHHRRLDAALDGDLVDVTSAVTTLASVASEEELDRVERAGEVLDEGMWALDEAIEPGVTERDLSAALGEACADAGGVLTVDYVSSAPMTGAEPGEPLPWKQPSSRSVRDGDVVTTEISAGYLGYGAQVHRPYAVGESPTDTYRDLFAVAERSYEALLDALQPGNTAADVAAATSPIQNSPYKVYDVVVHGYGGAYRHPFVGVPASNYWPGADDPLTADWTFEPGMVVVVQPNVVTEDERSGLQFGTTVVVREDGPDPLLDYPASFREV